MFVFILFLFVVAWDTNKTKYVCYDDNLLQTIRYTKYVQRGEITPDNPFSVVTSRDIGPVVCITWGQFHKHRTKVLAISRKKILIFSIRLFHKMFVHFVVNMYSYVHSYK